MHQVGKERTSCFAVVSNADLLHEIWIGKNNSITVLYTKNFKISCKLKLSEKVSFRITYMLLQLTQN